MILNRELTEQRLTIAKNNYNTFSLRAKFTMYKHLII